MYNKILLFLKIVTIASLPFIASCVSVFVDSADAGNGAAYVSGASGLSGYVGYCQGGQCSEVEVMIEGRE